jgi:hypothetical protein
MLPWLLISSVTIKEEFAHSMQTIWRKMQTNYKNNAKYTPIRLQSKCSSSLYQLTRLQRLVQRPQRPEIHQHTIRHHNSHRLRHHNYHHRWNHFDTFIPHIPHIKDQRKMTQQTTKEEELCKQNNQDTVRRLWCKKYRDIDCRHPISSLTPGLNMC